MPRKRLAKQKSQELISRGQFEEFISSYGWIASGIEPDLGEDVLVRIYREGNSTGLSFQVQLKSVKSIDSKLLKDKETISYRFDTKDLHHWDVQLIPVYLIIWDITLSTGWFISVKDAIKILNKNFPNWDIQKTVTVHIPLSNRVNDEGLDSIQSILTKELGPVILKDKELVINTQFSFPKDVEGQAKLKEFNRFVNSGDPVQLDGRFISIWDVPDFWKRVYGEPDPKTMFIQLGPSEQKQKIPIEVEFRSPEFGSERLNFVEFSIIKQGKKESTLSNEEQPIPYKIILILNKVNQKSKLTLEVNFSKLEAIEAKKAVQILNIIAYGGKLRLKILEGEIPPIEFSFSGSKKGVPDQILVEFVNNIYEIQLATDKRLTFNNDGSFTHGDYLKSKFLISIIKLGTFIVKEKNFIRNINKQMLQNIYSTKEDSEQIHFNESFQDRLIEVLNVIFKLGPGIQEIKGYWDMPDEEVKNWLETSDEEDTLDIKLKDVEITMQFENWKNSGLNTRA